MDLQACRGWELEGKEYRIRTLLSALTNTLYLYEPSVKVDQSPLVTSAPSLSTLSPPHTRIKEYNKSLPMFLYMPVWEFNELAVVARLENIKPNNLEDNYNKFGGIIRYTLATTQETKQSSRTLIARCKKARKDIFRSLSTDIDDDPKPDETTNVSGYIASQVDIPRHGADAFEEFSLAMTSEYANRMARAKFNLESARDRLLRLASHLDNKTMDITGIDLESAVVHMLAVGPMAVAWNLCPVGSRTPYHSLPLHHSKTDIDRSS